ncbi:MAG: sugar ABC transporter permease [Acetatifactor sp.]|nr:sugar ABC transporter permease [Acetatifactor sp.]
MKTKKTVKKSGLFSIFTQGDIFSKLSFIIMGISNIARKQIVKGLIYLAIEVGYIFYMVRSGFSNILEMRTLGTSGQGMVFDEAQGIYVISQGDNSMLILLYGVATIVLTAVFFVIWAFSVRAGEEARQLKLNNKKVPNFIDEVKALFDYNIHKLILAVPLLGIITFTVTPLIYMILIAFTNYDAEHQPPGNLFTWVGLANFKNLLSASGKLSSTFWPVLGWTFIWGFVATFSCYFGGMFLAMLINSKGIGGKKVWRTFFVTTMAIPSFITLLVVGTMLGKNGILNVLLLNWGFVSEPLPFLTNGLWAKITVIVVNIWIGVPVTMLMVTGILMNIPAELYESAKIDGAGPFMAFRKITFPYMWFITTPYLITNLIGNFNNFGVIYFLTGGNPTSINYYKGAGKTDLLVTWLYKLTNDTKDYNLASAIGIIIFIISAAFSLIMYTRSGALKNEEGFQ